MVRSSLGTLVTLTALAACTFPATARAQAPAPAAPSHEQAVSSRMKKGALFGALVGAGVGASIGYVTYFQYAEDPACTAEPCPADTRAPSSGQGAWAGGVVGVVVGGALGAILAKVTAPAPLDVHVTSAYVDPSSGATRIALRLTR